jgi:acetyl-CoA carboxylase biotin carboxyl carrier protein
MPLDDDDVREILRLIDESELDELHVESDGFSLHVVRGGGAAPDLDLGPGPAPSEPAAVAGPDGAVTISSPMLGTFYRAEAPGAAPFVDVGTRVDADSTVCLIEVMKMMSSVAAGVAGTIVEVCAENAQLVEQGQPLFRVEP